MDTAKARGRARRTGQKSPRPASASPAIRPDDPPEAVGWTDERAAQYGVQSLKAATNIVRKTVESLGWPEENNPDAVAMVAELIQEMKPASPLETMIISQMVSANFGALRLLSLAARPGQSVEGFDKCMNQAGKLMQLFIRQLEALSKLRGKSQQQKITVEHVNVSAGGQAIVGHVEGPGPSDRRPENALLERRENAESPQPDLGKTRVVPTADRR